MKNNDAVFLDDKAVELTRGVIGGGGELREGSLVPLKAGDKIYLDLSKAPELYIDDDYNAQDWCGCFKFTEDGTVITIKDGAVQGLSSNGWIYETIVSDVQGDLGGTGYLFITTNEQRNQLLISVGDGYGGGEHDQYGDIIDAQLIYEGELPPAPSTPRTKAKLTSDIISQLPILEIAVTEAMAGKYLYLTSYVAACLDHIEFAD